MKTQNGHTIAWWSGGITSAVACRLALEKYTNVKLIYIHIDSHHADTLRFRGACEEWYGQKIEHWQSERFKDQFDVIAATRWINGPGGARCTGELKKEVRRRVEKEVDWSHQVWGFDFSPREVNRAVRFDEQNPELGSLFPLIEEKLTKNACAGIINGAGIELPMMYRLGYNNNNCIGCVKGGKGYWNKIRQDFPETFQKMAQLEREIGAACIKESEGPVFLDNLAQHTGRVSEAVLPDCGLFCGVEFADVMSPRAKRILTGAS